MFLKTQGTLSTSLTTPFLSFFSVLFLFSRHENNRAFIVKGPDVYQTPINQMTLSWMLQPSLPGSPEQVSPFVFLPFH
jgi:hypothetical protein